MARLCHAPSALISGSAIDAFAEQVRVPVVPGVLLDHVLEDPPQRYRLCRPWREARRTHREAQAPFRRARRCWFAIDPVTAGANGRRAVPRLRSGRVYLLAHDPGMLADLPDPAEPVVLEQLDGRAEQEPPNGFATSGHLGDRLDETATRCGDLLEGAAEGSPRDAPPAMFFVNVEAGDPPVRQRWRVLFVFAPVLDGRKFFWAAVLAPSLSDPVVVEDQRRVRPALANLGLLGAAISRVTGAVHLKAFR